MIVSGDTIGYSSTKYSQLRKMHFRDRTQAMDIQNGRMAEFYLVDSFQ